MPRKLKTPEITYKEADNINSPEGQKALSDAYDILFEEVLRLRKLNKNNVVKRSNRRI